MTGVASIPVEKPVDVYDSDSDSEEAAGVSTMDIVNEISLDIIYDVAKAEFDAAKEIAEDERITIFMLRSSSVGELGWIYEFMNLDKGVMELWSYRAMLWELAIPLYWCTGSVLFHVECCIRQAALVFFYHNT